MRAVLQYCVDHQITFIPYFPLASGILAGKYDENTKFSDHRIHVVILYLVFLKRMGASRKSFGKPSCSTSNFNCEHCISILFNETSYRCD
ncbi:hypothetical protein [Staphylococcus aureus]|uniref:hypothetical protein n=1 Tax=Staphylococcus aureus TaxID=1280 RepID=UPI003C79ABAC